MPIFDVRHGGGHANVWTTGACERVGEKISRIRFVGEKNVHVCTERNKWAPDSDKHTQQHQRLFV